MFIFHDLILYMLKFNLYLYECLSIQNNHFFPKIFLFDQIKTLFHKSTKHTY